MQKTQSCNYILGFDLGSSSIGWAIIRADDLNNPGAIIDLGSRCFEAGVEGDIEQGKDSSRAVVRRQKRLMRRQIQRRSRRRRRILHAMQDAGLLPAGMTRTPTDIHQYLLNVDVPLRQKWSRPDQPADAHTWPYRIRAAALDRPLSPEELGRSIYHLGHRRGFLSNRKTDRDPKETGPVKEGIATLRHDMETAKARTLGEFFASLDPQQSRIRQRWTGRDMYKDEFNLLIAAQKQHHPAILTAPFIATLYKILFAQRPLKSSRHLIGMCELAPGKRRAAIALPVAQRFRLLAAVNNLRVFEPSGQQRSLTRDERTKIIDSLETTGDLTFEALRKLLDFKKTKKATAKKPFDPGFTFNLESDGGEIKILGNRTASKLRPIIPNWDSLPTETQDDIALTLCAIEQPELIEKIALTRWKLDKAAAKELSSITLEDGRAAFSRPALAKLVARMEEGLPYMTARMDEYPQATKPPVDHLPPATDALTDLRNPAVCRVLSELRKIVNAITARHGKPRLIRIELARELKQPRKIREQTWKNNRQRQGERDAAAIRITKEAGIANPTRADKEKFLLAEECNWTCPYTGRSMTMPALFGSSPQFDVEHIVPLSVSLDNSFRNKTLCYHEENRHRKLNRTPYDAYDHDSQQWHEILTRVRNFSTPGAAGKLEAFLLTPEQVTARYSDFTERHLADTRYASRLASEYLALLFGGLWDDAGKRRVQAVSGPVTAMLRDAWSFNGILNDGGFKTRSDHRHHAVDAAVIAMATPAMIKRLADAADEALRTGSRRSFAPVAPPWADCLPELRSRIAAITVSHRLDHRLAGALHAETNYSKPIAPAPSKEPAHRRRKGIAELSRGEVEQIADLKIRDIIKTALAGGDPKVVFKDPAKHPALPTKDGRKIPIHRVRVIVDAKPKTVGRGPRQRFVASSTDSNHHTVIVAHATTKGEKWEDHPVDRLEVQRRLSEKKPIVQRDWGLGNRPIMWLCKGDAIQMDDENGKPAIYIIRGLSHRNITFMPHNDARLKAKVKEDGDRSKFEIRTADKLRERHARKVTITPLGDIVYVNDFKNLGLL